jgi:hypothetical protein
MSKQLYEEALADVKKLKEIAEDNAKRALIEAVSPRIKDLIEAELLKEASEDDDDKQDDLLTDDGMDLPGAIAAPVEMPVPAAEDPSVAAAMSLPDDEGKVTLDLDALNVEPVGTEFELSNESIKLLNPIIEKINAATALKIESKLFQLNEAVQKLLETSVSIKKTTSYQKKILEMVSEIETVYEYLQESAGNLQDKGVYEGKLEQLYKQLNKLVEQYNMKNLKSLLEADLTLKLTNVPDDLPLEDLGVDIVADEGEGEEPAEEEGGEELDLGGEEGEGSEGEDEEESEETGDEELDLGAEEEKAEEAQHMESKHLSDNTIVEIDENMLREEIARMRSLREAADDVQTWGNGPGEVSDEFADEDMGDPFVDIDLTVEGDDVGETDEMAELGELEQMMQQQEKQDQRKSQAKQQKQKKQGMMQGMHQYGEVDEMAELAELEQAMQAKDAEKSHGDRDDAQSQKQNRMPEADDDEKHQVQEARRRLAHEARIQTEAKKKAQAAKKQQKEAQKKAQQKQQEAQQKAKQKKQQDAQKAKQEAQKQAKQAKKMSEAYAYYANIFNESVRRTAKLQSVLAESRNEVSPNGTSTRSTEESSMLRKKLAETNLYNTKLLYCNKLLQNESLTKRQKAEVIERLDEAKSEREVKLVYESLVKTLGRPTRSLSEGTQRVLGSSSQATRPASTVLSESYEADRWARLAGLK